MTLEIGWFATGTGSTSLKLFAATHEAIQSGYLDAHIVFVFCNRERGEDDQSDRYHTLVRDAGVPLVTLSDRRFRKAHGGEVAHKGEPIPTWRYDFDNEVMTLIRPYAFKVGVLAGYKLIFTREPADRWDLLNLHPAAPGGPIGLWQDVIWELIEEGAARGGVMIHLATPELDEGPPVTYCTYPIRGGAFDRLWDETAGRSVERIKAEEGESNPLFAEIRRQGVFREITLVIETLRAFAEGRVRIEDKRLVDSKGEPIEPFDLTAEIERSVARAHA